MGGVHSDIAWTRIVHSPAASIASWCAAGTRHGERKYQEDRAVTRRLDNGDVVLAILDGHGGDMVADFVQGRLLTMDSPISAAAAPAADVAASPAAAAEWWLELDRQCCQHDSSSGTTLCAVRVSADRRRLCFFNIGDSRAALIRVAAVADGGGGGGSSIVFRTTDHCVEEGNQLEQAGVVDRGGFIRNGRVNGVIAVTRSLGDVSLKPALSALPDVHDIEIGVDDDGGNNNYFLIVASDGFWDDVDADMGDLVEFFHRNQSQSAAWLVAELLRRKPTDESTDNTTIIVANLSAAAVVAATPEAAAVEDAVHIYRPPPPPTPTLIRQQGVAVPLPTAPAAAAIVHKTYAASIMVSIRSLIGDDNVTALYEKSADEFAKLPAAAADDVSAVLTKHKKQITTKKRRRVQ
jgi:serine/threonine protein phosphatase PrpC